MNTQSFFRRACCGFALVFFSLTMAAQTAPATTCDWISAKGYWVVESNKKTPKNATVYFYNNDHVLVYQEAIQNQKLRLNKKKTLYRLKAALEEAIANQQKGTWASRTNLVSDFLQQ